MANLKGRSRYGYTIFTDGETRVTGSDPVLTSIRPTTRPRKSRVSIGVLTNDRSTRRQVARALRAGGMAVTFLETVEQTEAAITADAHDLLILDCDNGESAAASVALQAISRSARPIPVVLLSLRHD